MTNLNNLMARFNELSAEINSVRGEIAHAFGIAPIEPTGRIATMAVPLPVAQLPTSQPEQRRASDARRGPRPGRTGYTLVETKAAEKQRIPPGNATAVYDAIKTLRGRKRAPVTARQIEAATGLKWKAVQSSVHLLRTIGRIQSNAIDGE